MREPLIVESYPLYLQLFRRGPPHLREMLLPLRRHRLGDVVGHPDRQTPGPLIGPRAERLEVAHHSRDEVGDRLAGAAVVGGEGLEQRLGVFVAAMLAPHHGKDAELGVARRAAEDFHGVGVFFRREVVFGNQLWGDGGFGHGKIFNSIKLFNSRVNFRAKLNFNPNKVKLSVALGNQKPKSTGSPLRSFNQNCQIASVGRPIQIATFPTNAGNLPTNIVRRKMGNGSFPVNAVTRPAGVVSPPTTVECSVLAIVTFPADIECLPVAAVSLPAGIDCLVLTIETFPTRKKL